MAIIFALSSGSARTAPSLSLQRKSLCELIPLKDKLVPFNCGRGTGRVRTREHGGDEAPDRAEAKRRREAQLLQDHPACRKLRKPCRLELVKQPTVQVGTGAAASFEVSKEGAKAAAVLTPVESQSGNRRAGTCTTKHKK